MDAAMRKHLAWKERRLLIPVCLTFAILLLLGSLLVSWLVTPARMVEGTLLTLAYLSVCTTGLAIGIVMFAPEREQGTDHLLSTFPVRDRTVANVKFQQGAMFFAAFALGAVLLVLAFRQFLPTISLSESIRVRGGPASAGCYLMIAVECLLWSWLCSMLCSRSIHATLAAAGLCFLGVAGTVILTGMLGVNENLHPEYMLGGHVLLTFALVVGNYSVGGVWLRRGRPKLTTDISAPRRLGRAVAPTVARLRPSYAWTSLVWQTCRTQWFYLALGLIGSLAYVTIMNQLAFNRNYGPVLLAIRGFENIPFANLNFAIIAGAFMGATAFVADQADRRYRFFQQQGEHPWRLWAVRLLPALVLAPVVYLVSAWLLGEGILAEVNSLNYRTNVLTRFREERFASASSSGPLAAYLTAAALGAGLSLLIRSGLLMVIATTGLTVALGAWLHYLAWLEVPFLYYGAPLLLTFLGLGLWYVRLWLIEKRYWTSLATAFTTTVAVFGLTVVGLRFDRLNDYQAGDELAGVEAMFADQDAEIARNPQRYQAALELKEGLALVRPISEFVPETDRSPVSLAGAPQQNVGLKAQTLNLEAQRNFVSANAPALEKLRSAVQDPNCFWGLTVTSINESYQQSRSAMELLSCQAELATREGTADAALAAILDELRGAHYLVDFKAFSGHEQRVFAVAQRLIRWAERLDHSEADVLQGLAQLREVQQQIYAPESTLLRDRTYLHHLNNLETWRQGAGINLYFQSDFGYTTFNGWLPPWEITRSLQRLKLKLATEQRSWAVQEFGWLPRAYDVAPDATAFQFAPDISWSGAQMSRLALHYTQTRFLLAAYRLRHGEYPATLAVLSDDYLMQSDVQAALGKDLPEVGHFAYSGTGTDLPVICAAPRPLYIEQSWAQYPVPTTLTAETQIEPGQPFLLMWPGLVQEKREFVLEVAIVDEEGVTPPTPTEAIPHQAGYWIPPQPGVQQEIKRAWGLQSMILPMATPPAVGPVPPAERSDLDL